jgi:sirohydrochlorin cobaltochelatase
MKLKRVGFVLGMLLALLMAANALAAGHGSDRPVKTGILLVAFGTSVPEAQVAFDKIDQAVKKSFPDTPVRWAYTSAIIRQKLAKSGQQLDSVATALAKMMDEGFTQVAVQSLHTIPGEEYHDLVQTARVFQTIPEGFDRVLIGAPLLNDEQDVAKVTEAIIANCPAERQADEGLVLMGHGTPHPANAFYAALMFHLQRRDSNIFVGTVEGSPLIEDIVAMLKEKKIKTVYLMPLMSVAGDHARNDMSGDEEDSWKSILAKAGIESRITLKGTAEYDNMTAIWIEHLKTAMAHFSK